MPITRERMEVHSGYTGITAQKLGSLTLAKFSLFIIYELIKCFLKGFVAYSWLRYKNKEKGDKYEVNWTRKN